MYRIIFVSALVFIILSVIKRPKKMKLKNLNNSIKINIFVSTLDKIISKNKYLSGIKKIYISKLQIVNYESYEHNNKLILKFLAFDVAISFLLLIALSNVITMWYAALTLSFVFFYLIIFFCVSRIESKIAKIHSQFPVALQCFLDEYIIHKNIKNAINNSYYKMPVEIGMAFEFLARELSGEKYELSIKKFADELSYVWGHCFAEILIMSYEGAGDITDDLLTLNSMVSEEITASEEEKSSRYGNKMTFIIV